VKIGRRRLIQGLGALGVVGCVGEGSEDAGDSGRDAALDASPRLDSGRVIDGGGRDAPASADSGEPSDAGPSPGDTGLRFLSNGESGSDIRLNWDGANLLPRTAHTVIWQARYVHQAGYYAVTWHTSNDGTWHASTYEFGCHPYPCTGAVLSSGQSGEGTGSAGEVQYFEIAGLGASDFIASPGPGPTFLVVKDVWLTQARTCEVVGGTLRHRFWPDVQQPSNLIVQDQPLADLATPTNPAFVFGCSPWTVSGSSNNETPSGDFRYLKLFSAALSIADIADEAASDRDMPATTAGAAAVWYSCINPTPGDVTDRSGTGRTPSWANANRPGLFTA